MDELLVSQRLAFNLKDIKPDPEILSGRVNHSIGLETNFWTFSPLLT